MRVRVWRDRYGEPDPFYPFRPVRHWRWRVGSQSGWAWTRNAAYRAGTRVARLIRTAEEV